MDDQEIETRFSYHAPHDDLPNMYVTVRAETKSLAKTINLLCPESREKSLSITALEEAIFWANASIARRS